MMNDFWLGTNDYGGGCYKLFSVENKEGTTVNFVIEPHTYFVDHKMMKVGDSVTGFYDANVPVPLIYPPQYRAVVMTKNSHQHHVKVDFFNNHYESSDGTLRLNIGAKTKIVLENGQEFAHNPANRYLIVVYEAATRSIPAQTTPSTIIVMC